MVAMSVSRVVTSVSRLLACERRVSMVEAEQLAPGVDLLGEPHQVVDHVAEVDGGLVAHQPLAGPGQRREELALRPHPPAHQGVLRGGPS